MTCGIIIAAAGQGKRMGLGINKQLIELNHKPILIHTLERFRDKPWVDQIVVVAHPDELDIIGKLVCDYRITVKALVPGGKERQESIANGLNFIDTDYVMVHDGARPFVSDRLLEELHKEVQSFSAVVPGVPVKETIKVVSEDHLIEQTPERKGLWAVQTPQAFRVPLLKEAYQFAKETAFTGTDDSSLVEKLGYQVKVLIGDYNNIKITTPEDLLLAQVILDNWGDKLC